MEHWNAFASDRVGNDRAFCFEQVFHAESPHTSAKAVLGDRLCQLLVVAACFDLVGEIVDFAFCGCLTGLYQLIGAVEVKEANAADAR